MADDSTNSDNGGLQQPLNPRVFRLPQEYERIWFQDIEYMIGKPLNSGAFGTIYECWDEWGNELAAKIIKPHEDTYEYEKSLWLSEMGNLTAFRHPNITYIHDAFEYESVFYLIIERCQHTLAELLSMPDINGGIWLPFVARDILHALQFMHANRLVHKDLHAGNIFVSHVKDRMVPTKPPVLLFKVGDLGISRGESDIRPFNTLLARWMLPPESLDNTFGPMDRRMDIYHLGLLLLRLMLNQEMQFSETENREGIPRQIAEKCPSPYSVPVSRALRRHVDQRIQTPVALWREIRAIYWENTNSAA